MEYNNIRHLMYNMTMVMFVCVACRSHLDHPPPALFHCQRRRDGFLTFILLLLLLLLFLIVYIQANRQNNINYYYVCVYATATCPSTRLHH